MPKFRILVLYHKLKDYRIRKTIDEHLYAFRNYVDNADFHYFNAANGIPGYLQLAKYDGVIIHYTLLAVRWNTDFYKRWCISLSKLTSINGYKVAIPHDEYAETDVLCQFFKNNGIETVFTCFTQKDYEKVYPSSKVNLKHRITVLPGYIDEIAVLQIINKSTINNKNRDIDIGYRGRKYPYWLGHHALKKHRIGEIFLKKSLNHRLKVDISNDPEDVFLGMDWYHFLCKCRVVLGCEGGASLMDPTGSIRNSVEQYVTEHPDAVFKEVEDNCFPGQDNNISLFTISPRHFECAITMTCQALIEGDYAGIFKPGVHYIEIKKDFSNIDEVWDKVKDKDYCEKIADNAYRDIVSSSKYTYRSFANMVISHIIENSEEKRHKSPFQNGFFYILGKYLNLREWMEPILVKVFYVWLAIKFYRLSIFKKFWRRIYR